MIARLVLAVAAAALVLVLAACGGSDGGGHTTTVVHTVTAQAPTDTTPTDTTPTTPTDTTPARTTTTEPEVVPTEPAGRTVHLGFFRSPSGNIGCVMAGGTARCDIRERTWSPPPRPSSCPLDYGQGLIVGRSGPGRYVCAGDTALDPGAKPLAYDTASKVGSLTCVSRENGTRCTNPAGHGFFMSRDRGERF